MQQEIFSDDKKKEGASDFKSWKEALAEEKTKSYFKKILEFVENERATGKPVYPEIKNVFTAFALTEFDNVKVVILGQDPYHGQSQAHGLCFSVKEGIRPPPSLVNIFKELKSDLDTQIPTSGCLERWSRQGVFLLNSVLTVEGGKPGSHAGKGWETFTDAVIFLLNRHKENLVFMLWGAYAQKKGQLIDSSRHLVLKAAHPSPFSAHNGFLGCRHFSKANEHLLKCGLEPINW